MSTTEFTVEELLALASGLGTADPVFLAGGPFSGWSPEVRAEVNALGRRSLAARAVAQPDDEGNLVVPEVLRSLCVVVGSPRIIVRVVSVDSNAVRVANLLMTLELCAVMRLTPMANFSFTLVPSSSARAVLDELLKVSDARWSRSPNGPDVRVTKDELARLLGVPAGAPGQLDLNEPVEQPGLSPAGVEKLRGLTGAGTAGWVVEILEASLDNRMATGSTTAWVATAAGLWLAVEGEGSEVVYRPGTAADIQQSIGEGLPAWLVESL